MPADNVPASGVTGAKRQTRKASQRPERKVTTGAVARLTAEQEHLPPTLQRVAAYVLAHREDVVYQTISELAAATAVGESTVTRLCRRLGFEGYHAFKVALTADISQASHYARTSAVRLSPLELAARQAIVTVESTLRQLERTTLHEVAARMVSARRVDIAGQGNSGLSAQFLANRLMRVGVPAVAYTDPHLAAVAAANQSAADVYVGVSLSGSTVDTVQSMKIAQAQGAFTVAVTNRLQSPIARYASVPLLTVQPEGPLTGGDISSLTSQLMVIEGLYLAALPLLSHSPEALRRTAESVVDKKY